MACLEWSVFVVTHANGGAAWKTGCFSAAPRWVTAIMAQGFRNPYGVVTIAGAHLRP